MTLFASFVMATMLLTAAFGARHELRRRRRARTFADFSLDERTMSATSVPSAVLLHRTGVLRGMNPLRVNRSLADIAVGPDRLLVVSDHGTLVDLAPGDPGLTSARATAPMRLVLEGELRRRDASPGLFRIELTLRQAPAWEPALARFVRATPAATRG
jgi:hypothetical protein